MSKSLPSYPVSVIDVPEVRNFVGTFKYNFFTKDESTNDKPTIKLINESTEINEKVINFVSSRIPKFVILNFTPTLITDTGREFFGDAIRNNLTRNQSDIRVSENITNVVSEDTATANRFTTINFHDADLTTKIADLISGTLDKQQLLSNIDTNLNSFRLSRISTQEFNDVSSQFLSKATSTLARENVSFFTEKNTPGAPTTQSRDMLKVEDKDEQDIASVNTYSQINTKFVSDMARQAMKNPKSLLWRS